MPTSQEKKPALKVRLAQFAKEKYPAWVNGGELEMVAVTLNFKASKGSRRCRDLVTEGTFERRMNGKSVEYRYKAKESQPERNPFNHRCKHCPRNAVTLKNNIPFCQEHLVKSFTPASLF